AMEAYNAKFPEEEGRLFEE
ncbi:hypothetical protein EVA_13608, partial [gut metagenome]